MGVACENLLYLGEWTWHEHGINMSAPEAWTTIVNNQKSFTTIRSLVIIVKETLGDVTVKISNKNWNVLFFYRP